MAAYVPDPTNVTTPLDSDVIGNVTPPEIRALKQHIIDKFGELQTLISTYNTALTQSQSTAASGLNSNLNSAKNSLNSALSTHTGNINNPHGTTKTHIGLSNLNDWGASSAVNSTSTTTYATAAAVKTVNDSIASLQATLNSINNKRTQLINAANAATSASNTSVSFYNAIAPMLNKDMLYLARIFNSGNNGQTWTNSTGKFAVVLEARTTAAADSNIIKLIAPNATYTFSSSGNFYAYVLACY